MSAASRQVQRGRSQAAHTRCVCPAVSKSSGIRGGLGNSEQRHAQDSPRDLLLYQCVLRGDADSPG